MKISLAKMRKKIALTLVFGVMLTAASMHAMSSNVPAQLSVGDSSPPVMCHKPMVAPFDHTADATSSAPIVSVDVLIGDPLQSPWLNGLGIAYQNKRVTTLTEVRTVQKAGTATFTADDPLVEVSGRYASFGGMNGIIEISFKTLSGKVFGPFCQKGGLKGPPVAFSLRGGPNTSIIGFKGVNKNNEYGTWKVGMLEIITAPLSGSSASSGSQSAPLPPVSTPSPSVSVPSSTTQQLPSMPSQLLPSTAGQPGLPSQVSQISAEMQSDITAFFSAITGRDWIALKTILGKYATNPDNLKILLNSQKIVTNQKINGVMTTPLHVAVSQDDSYFVALIFNSASRISNAFAKSLTLQRDGANKLPVDYAIPNSILANSLMYKMNSPV